MVYNNVMNLKSDLTTELMNHPEIERRWLVNTKVMPEGHFGYNDIVQVYTSAGRVRWERPSRGKERYVFSMKVGKGMVRQEGERLATKEEFELSCIDGSSPQIRKRRYYIPHHAGDATFIIELDYFHGNNTNVDGHFIAEIEYSSDQQARAFKVVPHWFGPEVTNDLTPEGTYPYSNKQLAKNGWPNSL